MVRVAQTARLANNLLRHVCVCVCVCVCIIRRGDVYSRLLTRLITSNATSNPTAGCRRNRRKPADARPKSKLGVPPSAVIICAVGGEGVFPVHRCHNRASFYHECMRTRGVLLYLHDDSTLISKIIFVGATRHASILGNVKGCSDDR